MRKISGIPSQNGMSVSGTKGNGKQMNACEKKQFDRPRNQGKRLGRGFNNEKKNDTQQ